MFKVFGKKLIVNRFLLLLIFTLLVFIYSIFVRLQGLGYSNLQGDEINTITFLQKSNYNFFTYLLEQKKGPMQYVINIANVELFGYQGEFGVRLPYAIFGILGIVVLGILASKIFDKATALITILFIATNGLFISFSRITQYQSFMYFLVPLTFILFIYIVQSAKHRLLPLVGLLMGVSVLNHYDGLSAMPFLIAGIAVILRNNWKDKTYDKNFIYNVIFMFIAFALVIASFYIPFYTHSYFENSTKSYLESRLTGGGFMPRTSITLKLLSMYQPLLWLYLLFFINLVGIGFAHFNTFKKRQYGYILIALQLLLVIATITSLFPLKPRTSSLSFILVSIMISGLLVFFSHTSWKKIALTVWYLGAFSFYLFYVKDPRTHVYMAMFPGFILGAYGLVAFYRLLATKFKKIYADLFMLVVFGLFTLICYYNWIVYVDRKPEYPWWNKQIFGQDIYKISKSRRIDGVFGFNNYRGWEKIGDLYQRGCLIGTYESNEKDNITSFYIGKSQINGDSWIRENGADTMIVVEGPHSWLYESVRDYQGYELLQKINVNDIDVTYIYGKRSVYPNGKMFCQIN